jgi:hypothetical protein
MRRFAVALVAFLFAVALAAQAPVPVGHTTLLSASTGQAAPAADPKVVFNTHSLIYHCASCSAAKRCTKSCITTTLADAKARGGRACKLCGGTCAHSSHPQSDHQESRPVQHVRCCDGSLSPSCTYVHSGCCSHHGGVCQ